MPGDGGHLFVSAYCHGQKHKHSGGGAETEKRPLVGKQDTGTHEAPGARAGPWMLEAKGFVLLSPWPPVSVSCASYILGLMSLRAEHEGMDKVSAENTKGTQSSS